MNVRKMMSNMAAAGIMAALLLQNMTISTQAAAPEAHGDIKLQPEVVQNGAAGVNVAYHTQEEIKNYINASGAKITDPVTFRETPVTGVPFAPGRLSDETLNSAIKMLNQIRYIAGIPYNVVLDDSYNEMAQAVSLVNYANKKMSHYPECPEGMAEELYTLGKTGAGKSNLAVGSSDSYTLNYFLALCWMEDEEDSNIGRVGHRRWLLNPSMQKTGFGLVNGLYGTHSAVYAFDSAGSASEYGVMWPAQNMPTEYFNAKFPWSISMGNSVDISKVHVNVKRNSDGKEWNFSQSSSDGAFYVDNGNYGQKGCIIFRPNGVKEYKAGDSYSVNIVTGLGSGDVSYTVNFFDLDATPTQSPYSPPSHSAVPTLKKLRLSSVKCVKNTKKITGKVSVPKAAVKIKVGKKGMRSLLKHILVSKLYIK